MRMKLTTFALSLFAIFTICSGLAIAQDSEDDGESIADRSSLHLSADSKDPKTSGEERSDSDTKLELSTAFKAQSLEDQVLNSKLAGAIFELEGARDLTPWLSLQLDAGMVLLTGTLTNRYTSEGAPSSGVELYKALSEVKPNTWTALQLGVLDIEFSSLVSVFEPQGFPGGRGILRTPKGSDWSGSIQISQTIPTSPTAEVKSSEAGVTSTLNLVSAVFNNDPKNQAEFIVRGTASHFQFNNLTTSAATDSKYLGNSTIAVGSQARFLYGFEGNEVSALFGWRSSRLWKWSVFASQLVNDQAPNSSNRAAVYNASLARTFNDTVVTLSGGSFFNESDTLPAAYAAPKMGNNNRFGWTAGLLAEFKKLKTKASLNFIQANKLETLDRPFQADRQILSLSVETKYEIL